MTTTNQPAATVRSNYELWQDTIDASLKDSRWHRYDCDLQLCVGATRYNLGDAAYAKKLDYCLVVMRKRTAAGDACAP